MTDLAYSYKKLQGPEDVQFQDLQSLPSATNLAGEELPSLPQNPNPNFFHRNPKTTSCAIMMIIAFLVLLSALSLTRAIVLEKKQAATKVPQVFQTTPELFTGMSNSACPKYLAIDRQQGPTATGRAPFLAESNPAPFGAATFVANDPLETAIPIVGNTQNANIFQLMGQLSPYFPNPTFVTSILYGGSPLTATVVSVLTKCLSLLERTSLKSTCCTAMEAAIRRPIMALGNLGQN